jgi:YfiH family protein
MILPPVALPFEWVLDEAGPALVCRPLAEVAPHRFTTRAWRLGGPPGASSGRHAWADVARALAVDPACLVRVRQVHGTAVAVARPGDRRPREADVVVLPPGRTGMAAAVQTADCVPLLLADPVTGAVAAAHAGWRGLAGGVPRAVVGALVRHCGSRAADLLAAVGPAIGACCYEVGPDVRDALLAGGFLETDVRRWLLPAPAGWPDNPSMPALSPRDDGRHWFFDVWRAARDSVEAAGVPAGRIFVAGLCTASHPAVLCSYRRDGARAGRMAAAIRSGPPGP